MDGKSQALAVYTKIIILCPLFEVKMKLLGTLAGVTAMAHMAFFPMAEKGFARLVDGAYAAFNAEEMARRAEHSESVSEAIAALGPQASLEQRLQVYADMPYAAPKPNLWQSYVFDLKEEGVRQQLRTSGQHKALAFLESQNALLSLCGQTGSHTPYHNNSACHAFTFGNARRICCDANDEDLNMDGTPVPGTRLAKALAVNLVTPSHG